MASASDSLRGASPTLNEEAAVAPQDQHRALNTAITGASQYACDPHPTVVGLSVCHFGVQTAPLTSNPATGAVFNRVQFQNVGTSGPGATGASISSAASSQTMTGGTGSGSTNNIQNGGF